jgi:hypothetical protein
MVEDLQRGKLMMELNWLSDRKFRQQQTSNMPDCHEIFQIGNCGLYMIDFSRFMVQ